MKGRGTGDVVESAGRVPAILSWLGVSNNNVRVFRGGARLYC